MAKVSYAKLFKPGFVPGLGEVPPTLPAPNKSWQLNMKTTDIGLLAFVTDSKNKSYTLVIPYASIELMSLAEESSEPSSNAA